MVLVRFSSDDRLEVSDDEIAVSIKSQPERGKANRELVKKLAAHFGVGEDRIRIVSGLTSRKKVVEVL
ncbi:DUF167 domain-containing protein [Candidatus Nitrososphaera gargensis]|uniref:DUF167 domain-containing protein n=1 Tax=Candidatus Nitrososphaera gargensis TaxID=497727 RepID=UPI001E2BBF43|nr:DUF167 domain-containing protein [Candidatus Nitrososphaera gargensis]